MNSSTTKAFSVKQQAAIDKLANAADNDVKKIAVTQLELLVQYYELSLLQSTRSFRLALWASGLGLFFLLGIILFRSYLSADLTIAGTVGGAMSAFIGSVNFVLYSKALEQLNVFQNRLENTQRFLLANSLCESLNGKLKDYTRARLIGSLAGISGGDMLLELVKDEQTAPASTFTLPAEPPVAGVPVTPFEPQDQPTGVPVDVSAAIAGRA